MFASLLLYIQQAGLTQNAEVLRYVVVSQTQPSRNLADTKRLFEQQANDTYSRILAQGLERIYTIQSFE
jgi:hypothetical protein